MAFGDGIISAFDSGLQSGNFMQEARRKKALREAFKSGYDPGRPAIPKMGPGEIDDPGMMDPGAAPSYNVKNVLAELYRQGMGQEAFDLESKVSQNEIAKMLAYGRLRPKLGEAKAGVLDGKDIFFRSDDRGNTYDMSGGLINGGLQPRPQVPLVNIDNKAEAAGLKKLSEEEAQLVSELKKNAIGGAKLLGPLNRMEQLNNSGNVAQGPLANFNQELGKFAIYLGAGEDVKKRVAAGEQYFAAAADAVRDKIKALGAGTAVSNVDLLFTRQSVGDLTNTQAGRALIIKAMKTDVENIQKLSRVSDAHFRGQGRGSLSGFDPSKHVTVLPELASGDAPQAEVTAVNPKTGEKLILRNGQWHPIK